MKKWWFKISRFIKLVEFFETFSQLFLTFSYVIFRYFVRNADPNPRKYLIINSLFFGTSGLRVFTFQICQKTFFFGTFLFFRSELWKAKWCWLDKGNKHFFLACLFFQKFCQKYFFCQSLQKAGFKLFCIFSFKMLFPLFLLSDFFFFFRLVPLKPTGLM